MKKYVILTEDIPDEIEAENLEDAIEKVMEYISILEQ